MVRIAGACVLPVIAALVACGPAAPAPVTPSPAPPREAEPASLAPAGNEPAPAQAIRGARGSGGVLRGGPPVVPGTPQVDARAAPPPDVLAFVRRLMAARDPEQHDLIDWLRQSTIAGAVGVDDTTTSLPPPSVPERRRGLPVGPPTGCVPAYTWSGGYEMLALPPPLDGWPEPVIARVQQAIDYLTAGHELVAWCTYAIDTEVGEDDAGNPRYEPRPTPGPAFVLNLHQGQQGWRVQAWSELRGQEAGVYPQD
jgi:hypothetical protein